MTDGVPEDNRIVADRVAMMQAQVEAEHRRKVNWPMIGSIAGIVLFAGLWGAIYLGKDGFASTEASVTPDQAITHDDQASEEPSSVFGDTSLNPEPAVRESEMQAVKDELAKVLKELKDAKAAAEAERDLPQTTKDELAAMRAQIDTMQSDFDAKVASYEGYIAQLKELYEDANRLPPRPVSLEDSKWIRAQQITSSADSGEAARLAAPSMVFDGSQEKREEEEEDSAIIIEQFGQSFPENATLTPAPQ